MQTLEQETWIETAEAVVTAYFNGANRNDTPISPADEEFINDCNNFPAPPDGERYNACASNRILPPLWDLKEELEQNIEDLLGIGIYGKLFDASGMRNDMPVSTLTEEETAALTYWFKTKGRFAPKNPTVRTPGLATLPQIVIPPTSGLRDLFQILFFVYRELEGHAWGK